MQKSFVKGNKILSDWRRIWSSHIIRFAFDSADDLYLIDESLIQIEKEKRRVDPEKFMAYIRNQVKDKEMHYLLLDEVQMLEYVSSEFFGVYVCL